MRRRHSLELHEQDWMPAILRNVFRDALSGTQRIFRVYGPIAPRFVRWLDDVGADGVLDLCSGSGGPALALAERAARAGRRPRLRLTDLYPDRERFEQLARSAPPGQVSFEPEPFDATDSVRSDEFPARTVLAAFHHFEPELARRIVADAARHADGIAVLEPMRRDAWHAVAFAGLAGVALIYPFLAGITWRRLLWCTLVPVIPLMFAFDGVVSVMRCYTPDELLALTDQPDCESFEWEAGHWRYFGLFRGTYLVGHRKVR